MFTTLFSQHDPAFDRYVLGKTRLTIHGWGCYVVSLANLYQVHPLDILKIPGAVNSDGLVVSEIAAAHFGGKFTKVDPTQPPTGWCIAQTNAFAHLGYPTHFFCVNPQLQLQVDPLDFPAKYEKLTYPIVNYRVFTNTKLDHSIPQKSPVLTFRLKRLLERLLAMR